MKVYLLATWGLDRKPLYLSAPDSSSYSIHDAIIFSSITAAQLYLGTWCELSIRNTYMPIPHERETVVKRSNNFEVTKCESPTDPFIKINHKDGKMKLFLSIQDAEYVRDELNKLLARDRSSF